MTSSTVKADYHSLFQNALDLLYAKDFKKAKAAFFSLKKSDELSDAQTADVLRRLASCYAGLGQTAKALQFIDEAIKILPTSADLLPWLLESKAVILLKRDEYKLAFESYFQAVELVSDPDNLEYLNGEIDDAKNQYQSYLRHGSFKDWKKKILHQLQTLIRQIESDGQ